MNERSWKGLQLGYKVPKMILKQCICYALLYCDKTQLKPTSVYSERFFLAKITTLYVIGVVHLPVNCRHIVEKVSDGNGT